MEKIIATTLPGLFAKSTPWRNAHTFFFQKVYKELNDKSMLMWAERGEDYIHGVKAAMQKLMPKASDQERAEEAKKRFLEAILSGIKTTSQLINKEVLDYFKTLKKEYKIALITTSRKEAIDIILKELKLADFFDIITAQKNEENQNQLMESFIKKYKPVLFIGGDRNDAFYICKQYEVKCLYANLENREGNKDIPSAKNLKELKSFIEKLI
ncbi:HAD hydrolase-like protein [Candidatus Woesearchaeota archaeon]|nr:HAD hydrolase-like protein [Candidatus Woesearchaeota archaeon]